MCVTNKGEKSAKTENMNENSNQNLFSLFLVRGVAIYHSYNLYLRSSKVELYIFYDSFSAYGASVSSSRASANSE